MEFKINVAKKNIEKLQQLVKKYNSTPADKRISYWEIADNIEIALLRTAGENGAQDEFLLQVLPEWADSYDALESADHTAIFDRISDFYDVVPSDPYRVDLKLVVIHHNWASMKESSITLEEFRKELNADLATIQAELG